MDKLKPQESETFQNALKELDAMAKYPHLKKHLSAETLFIAIAAIREISSRCAESENDVESSDYHPVQAEEMNEFAGAGDLIPDIPGTDVPKVSAAPGNDRYIDGVKYAIYEIMKDADISGSQEIRDSGDTDDGMCASAAKRIRLELDAPESKPLTLDQLRNMLNCPIWIENGCSNEYAIIYEITEHCIRARSPNVDYTLSFIGQNKTWLAYARKPEGSNSNA